MTHVSMGNLTGAFGFPHGPVPGAGSVSATHASVAGPAATATFAASDGPGSFAWCPGDPLCAAGGGMLASDPPQGAGPLNGRVIYRTGANRFGGVMRLLLGGGGVDSLVFDSPPFRVRHAFFGPRGARATGGSDGEVRTTELPASVVTQPISFMVGGLIVNPGSKVTTGLGLTNTMAGPPLAFPGLRYTETGFPWTTGTVFAQHTAGSGGDDFFTLKGSDLRTALGAGFATRRRRGAHRSG